MLAPICFLLSEQHSFSPRKPVASLLLKGQCQETCHWFSLKPAGSFLTALKCAYPKHSFCTTEKQLSVVLHACDPNAWVVEVGGLP